MKINLKIFSNGLREYVAPSCEKLPPKKARSYLQLLKDSEQVVARNADGDTFIRPHGEVSTKPRRNRSAKMKIGEFLVDKNKVLAELYKNDLERVAQMIPEATFIRELNNTSAKELKSILEKIGKRAEIYEELGYRAVIRDGVRARIFMLDADKNYEKIIEAMRKKKYKVAPIEVRDANGHLVKNPDGTYKMEDDIDVRFGRNARVSGYEDVQIRFQKGNVLYELIILSGPNYMNIANKEHEVFENIKKYNMFGLDKDAGAKQIIAALEEAFAKFTRRLYADALVRDKNGAKKITEPITFTQEEIKEINGLFRSLKNLYLGRYKSLPPSKQNVDFKFTKNFINLHTLETELKKFMEFYKPIISD